MSDQLAFEALALRDNPIPFHPCTPTRAWMSAFPDGHPYRCLPMAVANTHGWEIRSPIELQIHWNGGPALTDLTIVGQGQFDDGRPIEQFAESHFTRGIVTFDLDWLFRTSPGWNLFVTGPLNQPKHGIAPLSGVIETSWLPYTFTVNWMMTGPGTVKFDVGEPICCFFPVRTDVLQTTIPQLRNVKDDAEFYERFQAMRKVRDDAVKNNAGWQKHYYVGREPDGRTASNHITKLRLPAPVDKR